MNSFSHIFIIVFVASFVLAFGVTLFAGHWEVQEVKIYAPGHYEKVWVPDEYQDVVINGKLVRVKIRNGYWKVVWVPEHYRTEYVRVWVED